MPKTDRRDEHGVALFVAMLALLLLTAVAAGMMFFLHRNRDQQQFRGRGDGLFRRCMPVSRSARPACFHLGLSHFLLHRSPGCDAGAPLPTLRCCMFYRPA